MMDDDTVTRKLALDTLFDMLDEAVDDHNSIRGQTILMAIVAIASRSERELDELGRLYFNVLLMEDGIHGRS